MTRPFFETNTVSVVVGIVSIVAGAVILHYYLNRKKTSPQRKPNRNVRLRTLLDPNDKYQLPLLEKEVISNDTRRFRFGLPSNQHILGLPVGQHIHLIANIENDLIIRPYTPISSDDDLGYVDLLIKVYHKDVHPKFPLGGKMTQYLNAMEVGDKISFRGPSGRLQYLGNGQFSIKKLRKDPPKTMMAKRVNMIAGGTGITPMLQLIRHVLKTTDDRTKLSLLFANQSEQDILMREELDKLAIEHPQQFSVWYTVDKSDNEDWPFSVGYVKDDMMRDHLFPAAKDCLCLLCGPPPMVNYTCIPGLERLGHDATMRFSY